MLKLIKLINITYEYQFEQIPIAPYTKENEKYKTL